jgi:hypothetical protein
MKTDGLLRGESAQALVITAFAFTCLVGVLGLAVDVGLLLRAKRAAQTAADCAAISGAAELNYGGATAAAKAASAQNGITDGVNGTVAVHGPPNGPTSGPHAGDPTYVEVLVSQSNPTFFMQVFNRSAMTVGARAVAHLNWGTGCIYALDPTVTKSFWVTGSGDISIPACSIYIDSSDAKAMYTTGSGTISAAQIGIVGGAYNLQTVSPAPATGMIPVANPLAYLDAAEPFVTSGCTTVISYGSGTHTLDPGCYAKIAISGSGTVVNFNPGTYIINGTGINILSINGSGTITGAGVTFFVTGGGSATVTGSTTMTLSAPTSGTYDGILFWQSHNDTSDFTFTGSGSTNLNGIFYCSKALLNFTGSQGSTMYANVVAGTFKASGSFTMNNYALVNSSTPIRGSSLAE